MTYDFELSVEDDEIWRIEVETALAEGREAPPKPAPRPEALAWARALLGDDCFQNVVEVDFSNCDVGDDELLALPNLVHLGPEFARLQLHGPRVTDAALTHLKGLTRLKELSLGQTAATDAGLVHLKGLTGLKQLGLWQTAVRDAGMGHLRGLTGLEGLHLKDSRVTESGAGELRKVLHNCRITR